MGTTKPGAWPVAGKIADSIAAKGAAYVAAARENHHINLGPGPALEAEWLDAGLELPDLTAMREYRFERIIGKLNEFGYDGAIVSDPMNIRYASDSTNMQLWIMHNASRFAWIGADRSLIVWEFDDCEFLPGHNPLVNEVRPATTPTYYFSGPRYREKAQAWADEMVDVMHEHGAGASPRIAIDQLHYSSYKALEAAGVRVENGQEIMEQARLIKSPDEIKAMQCAVYACESAMAEMHEALEPGMTERELWAMLHAGNIKRAGEWIETQLLASGPRTRPWMQEASSRVIEKGDIVAYDTDMVGPYGMMCDISRSWVAGDVAPTPAQDYIFNLSREQIDYNAGLLSPGVSFRDLSMKSMLPSREEFFHYSVYFHGVGQCDEHPKIQIAHNYEEHGWDGYLEPGMALTVESYVARRSGGEGIKLEEQYLITETGAEKMSQYPIELIR